MERSAFLNSDKFRLVSFQQRHLKIVRFLKSTDSTIIQFVFIIICNVANLMEFSEMSCIESLVTEDTVDREHTGWFETLKMIQ